MNRKPKICKSCIFCHPHYGNKSKQGKRTISGYFCSAKNGQITTNPKKCILKKEQQLYFTKI